MHRRPNWIFKMKVKITCPKCGSEDVKITSDNKNAAPMYKCNSCGYEKRIFPKFESDKN